MKKLILLLLFLFPVLGLAQTNQQRIAIAIQNNSGYAKIIPFAQITVCTYNDLLQCNSPVTIYSDSALTQSIPYPFFADANGNFSYYSNAGTYIEKVCAPLNQCYNQAITLIASNSGSGDCTGTAGYIPIIASSGSGCTDSPADYGATASGTFTFLPTNDFDVTNSTTGDFKVALQGGQASFSVGNGFNVADSSTTGIDLSTLGALDLSSVNYNLTATGAVDESSTGNWEQSVGGNYYLSANETFFNSPMNWTGLTSGTAASCLALDSGNNVVLTTCGGSGSGAVLLAPGSGVTQTVDQQSGTSLNVNIENGSYYAAQFGSTNGIATAITDACTGTGCNVVAGTNYANTELLPAVVREASGYGTGNYLAMPNWPGLTMLNDQRGGFNSYVFDAPTGTGSYYPSATGPQFLFGLYFNSAYDVTIPGNTVQQQTSINQSVFNGPGNQINGFGGVNLKSYDFGPVTTMNSSDQGQHIGKQENLHCYGVGDCIGGAREMFVVDDGGASTYNDEGAHGGDFQVGEDLLVFAGSVSSTPAADATTFQTSVSAGAGTQGNGRYIIDKTHVVSGSFPSEYVSATVNSVGQSPPMETFVGTSFTTGWVAMVCDPAVDTCNNGLDPTGKINSVAGGYAPGPVTFDIVTSAPSMRTGYSTSTSGLASTGIACVADSEYFETTTYTVDSSSTLTINLRKPHYDGMTVGIGGGCQEGLEVTGGTYIIGSTHYRQVWPVVGNFNGTQLIVWDHDSQQGYSNAVLGNNGTAYCSTDSSPAAFSFSGTGPYIVTVFDSPGTNVDPHFAGQTAIVTTGNSTYNGTVAITYTTLYHNGTWLPAYQYSLASAPSGTAPTSGTIQFCNTSFNLYPMLEVLGVLNPSTTTVDGYFSVAPNSIVGVTAFDHGNSVEEPHYFWQSNTYSAAPDQIAQMMPRAPLNDWRTAGLNYQNLMSGGYIGWSIENSSPSTEFQYYGGTAPAPQAAYFANGIWKYDYEVHTAPSIGGAILRLDSFQPSPYGSSDPLNSPVQIYQGPGASDRIYDNPYTGAFSFTQPIQIGSLGFINTIYTPVYGTFAFSQDLGSSRVPDATIEAKFFQLYGTTPPTNYLNLEFYGDGSTSVGMQFPSADGGVHQTYQGGTLSAGGYRLYVPGTVSAAKTAGFSANSTVGQVSCDDATAGDAGCTILAKSLLATGNVVAASYTANGSTNGFINLTATGTGAPSAPANSVQLTVPNSVTPYAMEFPGAQPSGSNTYLSCTAANPSVCSWAAGGSSGGTTLEINGSAVASTTNINGTTPAAQTNFINGTWQYATGNASVEVPYATGSAFGVVKPDGSSITISGGVISAATPTGFIEQVPATTAANTIAPSATGVVPLTLNNPTGSTQDIFDFEINGSKEVYADQYGYFHLTEGKIISGQTLSISTSSGPINAVVDTNNKTNSFNVQEGWGGTVVTPGLVVAIDSSGTHTVATCAASCTNPFGVVVANPNSNNEIQKIGKAGVTLDGTYTITPKEYVCTSATPGEGTPQTAQCPNGQTIGQVDAAGTSVTMAQVDLEFGFAGLTSGGGGVTSFNSRTGAVVPASGDYTAAQITNAFDKSSSNTTLATTNMQVGSGQHSLVVVPPADDTSAEIYGTNHANSMIIWDIDNSGNGNFKILTATGFNSSAIPLSCQPGLGDGLNAIPAGTYLTTTCRNETGQTWTLTSIKCVADSGSSTCNATNGAGTALLTGAITGTSSYATGTQSATTTIASGDYLKVTFVADGTTKQIGIDVAGTY